VTDESDETAPETDQTDQEDAGSDTTETGGETATMQPSRSRKSSTKDQKE